jgi:hypothetical protein
VIVIDAPGETKVWSGEKPVVANDTQTAALELTSSKPGAPGAKPGLLGCQDGAGVILTHVFVTDVVLFVQVSDWPAEGLPD